MIRPSTIVLSVLLAVTLGVSGFSLFRHRNAIHAAMERSAELERDVEQRASAMRERERELGEVRASLQKAQDENGEKNKSLSELGDLRRDRDAAKARAEQLTKFVAQFKKLIDAGKLQVETRRGRLVLMMPNDVLFDEASIEIKPDGKAALIEVATTLKTVRDRHFQIAGHTDTMPVKTKEFTSNWDLSSARALSVVKLLLDEGVPGSILSATGCGQWEPRASNANPYGRAKNRRIEIVLEPQVPDLMKQGQLKM